MLLAAMNVPNRFAAPGASRALVPAVKLILWPLLLGMVTAEAYRVEGAPARPVKPPNIVLIMTDDQGFGDLGVTGNKVLDTPHIDRLARAGAAMETFYVSPVCAPTRASLMTGRYNYRTRVIDTYKGRAMMEPDEVTIAEVLKEAGYRTGIFGKWHLGDCYPMRPMDQGFEESLVHRGGGLAQPSEPIENHRRYTDPILLHNGRKIRTEGYCTDVYFDAALDFIDRARADDDPFFIYLPPNAPHGPFHDVPEELYQKYRQRDLSPILLGQEKDADIVARVFAMIENIDQNVGRLMRRLEATGLAENTLVIFMVDNGPNTRRYVGPFRGKKAEVHEGGIRSPFLAHWPARLEAGTSSDRLAAHIDVMPTLLEAAGVPVPDGLKLDGRSFLPLLEGRTIPWPDRTLVIQSHRGDAPFPFHHVAVRQQRWVLVHPTGFGRETPSANRPFELYDVVMDPDQSSNLAEQHPDKVRQLKLAYQTWFEDVSQTRPDNFAPPRIVVGTDHETRTVLTWQDWQVHEGGGWGHRGQWRLSFASDQTYDIEFLWPGDVQPGTLELHVGSQEWQREVRKPTRKVVLENVRIPQGPAELWAVLKQSGNMEDVYHVVLSRQ